MKDENGMDFAKYLNDKIEIVNKVHAKERQAKTHYCGAFFFPKWLLKLLSKDFNLACKEHDENYAQQDISRIEADRLFLRTMIKNNPNKKFQARMFFYAVRIYGGFLYTMYKPSKNITRNDVIEDYLNE